MEKLKNCIELSEMPRIVGSKTLRAKAYLCHLAAVTEDASIKSETEKVFVKVV